MDVDSRTVSDDARGMDTGAAVRALRERLGLSQEAVAERGGFTRSEMSKIESGANKLSSLAMLQKLASGFGVSPVRLTQYVAGRISLDQMMDLSEEEISAAHIAAGVAARQQAATPQRTIAFESSLKRAFKAGDFEIADLDAVRGVFGASAASLGGLARLDEAAVKWLSAAKKLRDARAPINPATLAWAMAEIGQDPRDSGT
jgi:transcriptional regulator with XRE-family HTH domain